MKYLKQEWVDYHATNVLRTLRGRHPNAKIDHHYTVGTLEADDLLTLQISIDLGKPVDPITWSSLWTKMKGLFR